MAKRRNPHLRLWVKPHQLDYRSIHWYEDANQLIVREYGDDADFFCKLLAATSPRKQVKANWKLAARIYRTWKRRDVEPDKFGDVLGGLMPAHANNVIRTLQGKPLSGLKVNAFYRNLMGDLSVVTIDMWIIKAYGLKKSLTELQYKRLTDKITAEAESCGLLPAQYQALVWTAARRESGKNYSSFVASWYDLCERTLWD
jgi:hypothetical protein